MATPTFRLVATPPFDRSLKQLAKKNAEITDVVEELFAVLQSDPYNTQRRHNIRKLVGVDAGDGQWRIRSGIYRLRYDILGPDVVLYSINHRKEAY